MGLYLEKLMSNHAPETETLRTYDQELSEWRQKQKEARSARLAPVRSAIISALFQYDQTLQELEDIARTTCEPLTGYPEVRDEDVLNSLIDLTDEGKIRIVQEGSRRGQFELSAAVASSSWELPEA